MASKQPMKATAATSNFAVAVRFKTGEIKTATVSATSRAHAERSLSVLAGQPHVDMVAFVSKDDIEPLAPGAQKGG